MLGIIKKKILFQCFLYYRRLLLLSTLVLYLMNWLLMGIITTYNYLVMCIIQMRTILLLIILFWILHMTIMYVVIHLSIHLNYSSQLRESTYVTHFWWWIIIIFRLFCQKVTQHFKKKRSKKLCISFTYFNSFLWYVN